MKSATIAARPSAPISGPGPAGPPVTARVGQGNRHGRNDHKVPLSDCGGCGKGIHPNKTGLCRTCWETAGRPTTSTRKPQGRKREPREQVAAATRILLSAARRAVEADPDEGLAALLKAQADLTAAIRSVGRDLVEDRGSTQVAEGLGWSQQRVWERWGVAR